MTSPTFNLGFSIISASNSDSIQGFAKKVLDLQSDVSSQLVLLSSQTSALLSGKTVSNLSVSNGNLVVLYRDATTLNLGSVIGPQGIQGIKGDTGAKGDKGDKGDTGLTPDLTPYARRDAVNIFNNSQTVQFNASTGSVQLSSGDTTHSGQVGFFGSDGLRHGYMGFSTADSIYLNAEGGRKFVFSGGNPQFGSYPIYNQSNVRQASKDINQPCALFNVIDYGADPSAASDSAASIQSALNAMAAPGSRGGILYFPPGSYLMNTNVIWSVTNAPLYILGAGRGQSTILQNSQYAFVVSGNGRFQMEGLYAVKYGAGGVFLNLNTAAEYVINNIRAVGTSGAYWDAFFNIANPLLGTIKDIYVRNTPEGYNTESDLNSLRGTGFNVSTSAISVVNVFENVYFAGFYKAFYFKSDSFPGNEGNTFTNCVVEACRIGIHYANSKYTAPQAVSWIGGHMNCYERCFLLESCSDPHIIGGLFYRNVVFNIPGQHIFIGALANGAGGPTTGAMITNNTFRVVNNGSGKDAGGVGSIHIDGGDWHTVIGNKFDLSPGFAYAVYSTGTNTDVQFNKSRGSGLSGTGCTVAANGGYSFGNRTNGGTPG